MNRDRTQGNVALLVIDVQRGLFQRSTPIYHAEQLLENINILIRKARAEDIPVIFVQHSNEDSLRKGSYEWRLHANIQPLADEIVIHKLHGDAFIETNLQSELTMRNIKILVVTGLVTHGCVKATSLGAIDRGYKVFLVSDGHSNFSKGAGQLIDKWNRIISEKGADLVETKDVEYNKMSRGSST